MMSFCCMPKVQPGDLFEELDKEELVYLNSQNSLTKKIYVMAEMLSMAEDEHAEREEICSYIFNLLRPYYPECDILVFGSSANGFGCRGCDLDLLFLPFPVYCNLDFEDKGTGVIPSPTQVLKDEKVKQKLYLLDEKMHLKFVQKVLYGTRRYFKNIFFVPAKCPILNIKFCFTPIHCDFSASNRLVLFNTQLLWTYGRLDPCVKPLVMFLRYWAKSLHFISKSLLSSYAMTLLVIFFLQNTDPAILPSVQDLNQKAGYSRIIDGWETAICINENRCQNRKSLGELLLQFFDFYWNFDFVENIVSVHSGKPLPVKMVKESNDERIKTFPVTPFSVQDPFILSRNVSRNTTMKTPFKLSLMIAKQLLLKRNLNFQLLFDSAYYQDEIDSIFASTNKGRLPGSTFLTLQLNYDLHNRLAITSQLNPWFDKVGQAVLDALNYGLLIDCEVVDKAVSDDVAREPPAKKQKFNIKTIGILEPIISIQCIVNFPTLWRRNRNEVLEHLKKTNANLELKDPEVEFPASLQLEHKISEELCNDEIKNVTNLPNVKGAPPYFSFTCDCFHYPDSQISDIVIRFSPRINRKTETKEFLKSFVHKYVKRIILQES